MLQDIEQAFCDGDLFLSLTPINMPTTHALARDPVCYVNLQPHLKREAQRREVPQCYAQLKQCAIEKAGPW